MSLDDLIVQTEYSQTIGEAMAGQIASAVGVKRSRPGIARGLVKAGYGLFRAPVGNVANLSTDVGGAGLVYHQPDPAPAADVDAITATCTSATGAFLAASADGVVGDALMVPARKLTFTFDASTDWDATTGVVVYQNDAGRLVSENIAIATSTAATTTGYASKFISFTKPAQTGSGGNVTIGVAVMDTLVLKDFLGVAIRQPYKTMLNPSNLYGYPGQLTLSVTANYTDGESVPVLEGGDIWVYSEEAVADRDPVYVRVASGAGGSVLGAFRNDADTASCVLVTGARFCRTSTGAGPAWARIPLDI